jgi:hypothetical protein
LTYCRSRDARREYEKSNEVRSMQPANRWKSTIVQRLSILGFVQTSPMSISFTYPLQSNMAIGSCLEDAPSRDNHGGNKKSHTPAQSVGEIRGNESTGKASTPQGRYDVCLQISSLDSRKTIETIFAGVSVRTSEGLRRKCHCLLTS